MDQDRPEPSAKALIIFGICLLVTILSVIALAALLGA